MRVVRPVIGALPTASATANPASREERQQGLRSDQIIQATVAEGGRDKVLLAVGKECFPAFTRVPLKTGQKLDLLIDVSGNKIQLQIVRGALIGRLGAALQMLSRGAGLESLLRELRNDKIPVLKRLSPDSREALEYFLERGQSLENARVGTELRQWLERLGLGPRGALSTGEGEEEGAGTLKGALVDLSQKLDNDEGGMAKKVGRLLQVLEAFELCSLRLAEQGTRLFPLPPPFLEQGYLLIEERRKRVEGEEEPPWIFSLHLNLSGLGGLRVDFLFEPSGLSLRFVCESPEKARFVSGFQDRLKRLGEEVPIRGVAFSSGAEDPVRSLGRRILPEGQGVVDDRV